MWKKYNRFTMPNSAVRGPFVPLWSSSCSSDAFLSHVTDLILQAGSKVDTLMLDFRKSQDRKEYCNKSPVETFSRYPYETIFMKVNRDVDSITIARLEEWQCSRHKNGSWVVCRRGSWRGRQKRN